MMIRTRRPFFLAALSLLAAAIVAVAPLDSTASSEPARGPLVEVAIEPRQVTLHPLAAHAGLSLKVRGPDGRRFALELAGGGTPVFGILDPAGVPLADGHYVYELTATPKLPAEVSEALRAARAADDDALIAEVEAGGFLPAGPLTQSGSFAVAGGAFVLPGAAERRAELARAAGAQDEPLPRPRDIVENDDLIIVGSLCVGLDCVNGEDFNADTIRLKENNLRINFTDTSNTSSFATRDWTILVNDQADGGLDRFSIQDIDAGTTPMTIEGGAPTNSLYVDNGGRLGVRTSNPVLDAHISSGNSPAVRLEQNATSGFTAQTWDIAGNEANFFVRDVTGGSRLPLRIRPGAPTSSIDVAASGSVGMGTSSPTAPLHVQRSDGSANVSVEETNATTAARTLMTYTNNGPVRVKFVDTSSGINWIMKQGSGAFVVSKNGSGLSELELGNDGVIRLAASGATARFTLDAAGNVAIAGTLMQNSDRDSKHGFAPIDAQDVLERVAALPITTWTFKADEDGARHMGPMAQDFAAAFGLGVDEKRIAPVDVEGVALAALQGLHQRLRASDSRLAERDAAIAILERRNADLELRLAAIEGRVAALAEAHRVDATVVARACD